ncbi:MAG: adenosine deaminase, partial [Ralstonia mannitolilytica]
LILCFLRHLSEEDAFTTLEAALPYIQDPANRIIGVGLDSSERGNPPEKFARVFARCKELGLRLVAHAGEEGPAQYVTDALDILKVERIDHGVRAIDDAALVRRLAAERIALTVCPLSNEKLKVYPDLRDHSLKQLLNAGCAVTLHSDDPAYFGGYMNANWLATFDALDLSAADAHTLARNSFEASFLPEQDKALWLNAVDVHWNATH